MNFLLILNDPPYGTERSYNGLRLANSLMKEEKNTVAVFLMGDVEHRSSMDELTCRTQEAAKVIVF